MRKTIYPKISNLFPTRLLTFFVLLFLNLIFLSHITTGEGENQLFIEINDIDHVIINEVYEGDVFIVSIYMMDINGKPIWYNDFLIEFNGILYYPNDNAEVELDAPTVKEDALLPIIAYKDNHITSTNITIRNKPLLTIIPETYVVEANKKFSVRVKDENDNPIENADVFIQSVINANTTTNKDGVAWLTAPETRTEIILIASKIGFFQGSTTIGITNVVSWIQWIMPVMASLIILLIVIVIVQRREKQFVDDPRKNIPRQQTSPLKVKHSKVVKHLKKPKNAPSIDEGHSRSQRGPKIEEIRISRPRKDKEIAPIDAKKEESKTMIPIKRRSEDDYEWFKGRKGVRYDLDRITGELDEKSVDKWFEGIDEIRVQIDRTLKKKNKKH